jgi:hypothetical protein
MAFRVVRDDVPALLKAISDLTGHQVLIGIPGDAPDRTQTGVGIANATLGFIHEYGAPSANIPARPFLVPGVAESLPRVIELLRQGARRAIAVPPDPTAGMRTLHSAGITASNAVKRYILRGLSPPLAPATIYKRQHRKVARRMGTKPLVDTGQLYRSVQYVIRKA